MLFDRARVAAALPAYDLGDELGSGAFGVVVRAQHRQLERPVAVKVVHVADDVARRRFVAEARLLAAIDHPHVVRVFDYVEADPLCLIVMELLDGGTLTRRRLTTSPEAACAVGLGVAAALSRAHERGVLHRDVKPDNVLFGSDGFVKTADFGIAKVFAGAETTASMVSGTPRYMAPEQIVQGQLGPGTDLFALGVVLHELLAGRPFYDPTLPLFELYNRTLHAVPDPLDGAPPPVADVVLRALSKDRTDRQHDAHAFALELARAAARAFGTGWAARSGVLLQLDDDVRAAAESVGRTNPAAGTRTNANTGTGTGSGTTPASTSTSTVAPASNDRGYRPQPRVAAAVSPVTDTPPDPLVTVVGAPPASASAASASPASAYLASVPTPEPSAHVSPVDAMAFSGDGRLLASAGRDGLVILSVVHKDGIRPRPIASFRPYGGVPAQLVGLSGDGRMLMTSVGDHADLWHLADPTKPVSVAEFAAKAEILSVRFAGTSGNLWIVDSWPGVTVWDVHTSAGPRQVMESVATAPLARLTSADLSGDGRLLALGARYTDVSTCAVTRHGLEVAVPLPGTAGAEHVSCSPDGQALAVSRLGDVSLWDVADPSSPRHRHTRKSGRQRTAARFSPAGKVLATPAEKGDLTIVNTVDLERPTVLGTVACHSLATAFSPDGARLATTTANNGIRAWRIGRYRYTDGRQPGSGLPPGPG